MDEEYEIKWWKDWLEADSLVKEQMVEKLPFIKELINTNYLQELPERIRKRILTTTLNSFFEDLQDAMYTKIHLENQKKSKNRNI